MSVIDEYIQCLAELMRSPDAATREIAAQAYEQHETEVIDSLVSRYGLINECGCSHAGPHWAYMQKFSISQNAAIIRRGGQLVVRAFSVNEESRLKTLRFELRTIEDAAK